MIFLDTPGIHKDSLKKAPNINERINAEAFASLREADVILRFIDPTRPQGIEDERIDTVLSFINKPIIRVETKQDLTKSYPGKNIDFKINSISQENFEPLLEKISESLLE